MLMYTILKSKTRFLMAECLFIGSFVSEIDVVGQGGYALATFETALEQIARTPVGQLCP